MQRLIVSGFSSHDWQVYFIKEFSKRKDLKLLFWPVLRRRYDLARAFFPSADVIPYSGEKQDLIKATANPDWLQPDKDILRLMSTYELQLWPSYLRFTQVGPFTHGIALKDDYHKLLSFRYNLISYYKPDIYFFPCEMTSFLDFADYVICREMGIETLCLSRCWQLQGKYAFPTSDLIKNGLFKNTKNYNSGDLAIPENIKNYFGRVKGSYSSSLPEYDTPHSGFSGVYQINKKINKIELRRHSIRFTSLSPRKIFGALYIPYMRRLYRKFCVKDINYQEKYILVCLHSLPEASSIPYGGEFAYQYFMISMIASELPEGFWVYVKEHPDVLSGRILDPSYRFFNPQLYRRINSISNVRIVPYDTNNFELIDNSCAVATLTGTVGLEALIRDKPILVFGYPWYQSFKGCFRVRNRADLSRAFDQLISGRQIPKTSPESDLKRFLKYCVQGLYLFSDYDCISSGDSPESYGIRKAAELEEACKALSE